jgi:hypothetical protein
MRVLIDSSVRIDHLRGVRTRETAILGTPLAAGKDVLLSFEVVTIGGADLALEAADHYRALRRLGVTMRKTIDLLIGTYCIAKDCALLHSDRDFDPMMQHLGLRAI